MTFPELQAAIKDVHARERLALIGGQIDTAREAGLERLRLVGEMDRRVRGN